MRKIWNRPSYPVWSLSTVDQDGVGNMNICTYVTPIALQPKMMLVSLYHHTKTLENVQSSKRALLQLLTEELAGVVRVCGRQSGHAVDKIARLQKRFALGTDKELSFLAESAGYMELEFTDFLEVGADHLLGVANVISAKNLATGNILTTDYLKDHQIIR